MLLVGTYVGLSKPLTAAVPVFVLALLRFVLGFCMMLHWLSGPRLMRSTWVTLALQSFVGNFLFSIFMLYGVKLSSAVAAGLVMSILPAVVALMSMIFLREHLTRRVWLAIVLSLVGVALLNLGSAKLGAPQLVGLDSVLLGNLLLLIAVFCEAVYVVTGKKLSTAITAKRNSALVNVFGMLFMLPLGIWQYSQTDFQLGQLSASLWALLVFYAFAASVGSVWLSMTGLRHVPASRAGVFSLGLPVAAVLVGVVYLGEQLTWLHGLAFVLCALALLLITSEPTVKKPPAPTIGQAK
jgi:drug/metabolite transporter (DMT)-like permease